jgi:type IV pilus assembly protein PilW
MQSHAPVRQIALGFSLIELMISVVIGLLGVMVIFQVLSVWDSRKRTATAGSDAQIAGNIGMFNFERDLKLAGYGFGSVPSNIIGCAVKALNAEGQPSDFSFLPVEITQGAGAAKDSGAGGAPDQVAVLYGNSNFFVDVQRFTFATNTSKKSQSRVGIMRGDLIVVSDNATTPSAANCAMVEVTDDSDLDELTFVHAQAVYEPAIGPKRASRFNPAGGVSTGSTMGRLFNLGPSPSRNVWQIRNGGVLAYTDTIMALPFRDIAEGIVDLQAQYGVGSPVTWTANAPPDWTQVSVVRVAILSRSKQYEPTAVTAMAPTYFGNSLSFNMDNVFGEGKSDEPNHVYNWRNYRYRVYEKVIPLRNMIWGRAGA